MMRPVKRPAGGPRSKVEAPPRKARPSTHANREREAAVEDGADAPQKLQKILAQSGLGSRRAMEEWITDGRILVNGKLATLGMRVSSGDQIKVATASSVRAPSRGRRAFSFIINLRARSPVATIRVAAPACSIICRKFLGRAGSTSGAWISIPAVYCCSRLPASWPTV